jgi:hypothetical protein
MSIDIQLTPQEFATLKRITKVEDDAEAVTQALREFLRLTHLRELKTVSGKVEFDANWQELEALELGEREFPQ